MLMRFLSPPLSDAISFSPAAAADAADAAIDADAEPDYTPSDAATDTLRHC